MTVRWWPTAFSCKGHRAAGDRALTADRTIRWQITRNQITPEWGRDKWVEVRSL